jgi:hypothetical protein
MAAKSGEHRNSDNNEGRAGPLSETLRGSSVCWGWRLDRQEGRERSGMSKDKIAASLG